MNSPEGIRKQARLLQVFRIFDFMVLTPCQLEDDPSVKEDFGDLFRSEMLKDLVITNSVRLCLEEGFDWLPDATQELLRKGGMVYAEDVELLAYPPAWDNFPGLDAALPATYQDISHQVRSCDGA